MRSEPPDPDPQPTQAPANPLIIPPHPTTPDVVVPAEVAEANALNILVQEKFRRAMEEENLPPIPPERMSPWHDTPFEVQIEADKEKPRQEPIPEETEKLPIREPVTVRAAAEPTPSPMVIEMAGLLEGAFEAGVAIPVATGAALSSGALSAALAAATALSASAANALAANAAMSLMEQTLLETSLAGQFVQTLPAAEAPELARNYPAGVSQAGVSPTQQSTVAKNTSKIISTPVTSVLPYQGFIVQAMMELAFGNASKAIAPPAGKLLQFTAPKVKPVVQQVQEFGSFMAALLP